MFVIFRKLPIKIRHCSKTSLYLTKQCHGVFGIKDLMQQDKSPHQFRVSKVTAEQVGASVDIIKRYFLSEHVLVQARKMDLSNDRALDEYLATLLLQGNSLYAKAEDGTVAGLCVSHACSPVDTKKLRHYAFYRQDPNTKDFLYFTAKLQETPNLWDVYKQPKVFEIKMITVLPEYRRQGLATLLAEKSKELAYSQRHKVVRMDCINPYDYKIAERCMLQCIVKFPLHKVRYAETPFIKKQSEHNRCVRVYVHLLAYDGEKDTDSVKQRHVDLENLIE